MRWDVLAKLGLLWLFSATSAWAEDTDWFCTEVASQRSGGEVRSCGVGTGADENAARRAAFDNAKAEFSALCQASADCRGKAVNVTPERTSCEDEGDGFKCYRLLVFSITEDDAIGEALNEMPGNDAPPAPVVAARRAVAAERLLAEVPKEEADSDRGAVDREELPSERRAFTPQPFDGADQPKIRVGMTKAEALKKFGRPDVVREGDQNVAVFYRLRPFCDGRACVVRFERESGLVVGYTDFRYEFTDALN